jgi:error-prone DNA polymerase
MHSTAAPRGRLDGGDGKNQRDGDVVHLVAQQLTDMSAALASIGERDAAFPLPPGQGDEFHGGSPGVNRRTVPKARDIYDPYGHIDRIRVKPPDFRSSSTSP